MSLPLGIGLRGLSSGLPDSRMKSFVLFIELLSHSYLDIPAGLTLSTLWLCLVCLNLPAQPPETLLWIKKTPQCSAANNVCSGSILILLCFYSALMSLEEPLGKVNFVH